MSFEPPGIERQETVQRKGFFVSCFQFLGGEFSSIGRCFIHRLTPIAAVINTAEGGAVERSPSLAMEAVLPRSANKNLTVRPIYLKKQNKTHTEDVAPKLTFSKYVPHSLSKWQTDSVPVQSPLPSNNISRGMAFVAQCVHPRCPSSPLPSSSSILVTRR